MLKSLEDSAAAIVMLANAANAYTWRRWNQRRVAILLLQTKTSVAPPARHMHKPELWGGYHWRWLNDNYPEPQESKDP